MEIAPHMKSMTYVLREPNPLYTGTWKVTARFSVQLKTGVHMPVVRLRHGVGPVKHFSRDELERLFAPVGSD